MKAVILARACRVAQLITCTAGNTIGLLCAVARVSRIPYMQNQPLLSQSTAKSLVPLVESCIKFMVQSHFKQYLLSRQVGIFVLPGN